LAAGAAGLCLEIRLLGKSTGWLPLEKGPMAIMGSDQRGQKERPLKMESILNGLFN
jgi:hypothetical protein